MTDILDRIDAATGCQQCEGPLGDSPSDDFCSARCQANWQAGRAVPLTRYREASRVESGSDGARWCEGTAVDGWATSAERWLGINGFSLTEWQAEVLNSAFRRIDNECRVAARALTDFGREFSTAMAPHIAAMAEASSMARALALELRKRRNTGPRHHQRAPRTIGRPR